jgi:hypothetical protein
MDLRSDAPGRPAPEAFQRAVAQFAKAAGLPPEPLVRGDGFRLGQQDFWFVHHALDPEGVTVMADVCELPPDRQEQVDLTRNVLEYHASAPVAVRGLYGYTPTTHRLVYSMRIALDQVDDAAQAIADTIAGYVALKREVQAVLEKPLLRSDVSGHPAAHAIHP